MTTTQHPDGKTISDDRRQMLVNFVSQRHDDGQHIHRNLSRYRDSVMSIARAILVLRIERHHGAIKTCRPTHSLLRTSNAIRYKHKYSAYECLILRSKVLQIQWPFSFSTQVFHVRNLQRGLLLFLLMNVSTQAQPEGGLGASQVFKFHCMQD